MAYFSRVRPFVSILGVMGAARKIAKSLSEQSSSDGMGRNFMWLITTSRSRLSRLLGKSKERSFLARYIHIYYIYIIWSIFYFDSIFLTIIKNKTKIESRERQLCAIWRCKWLVWLKPRYYGKSNWPGITPTHRIGSWTASDRHVSLLLIFSNHRKYFYAL